MSIVEDNEPSEKAKEKVETPKPHEDVDENKEKIGDYNLDL